MGEQQAQQAQPPHLGADAVDANEHVAALHRPVLKLKLHAWGQVGRWAGGQVGRWAGREVVADWVAGAA